MTHPPIVPGQQPGQVWPPNPSHTTDPFAEPVRRRVHPALLATVAVLVLAVAGLAAWLVLGGSDSGSAQTPAAAAASSSTPAAAKGASAPAAAAPKAKTSGLKLGAKVKVPADDDFPSATVQVIEYKRDTSGGEGYALDAVRIRVCLGTEHQA